MRRMVMLVLWAICGSAAAQDFDYAAYQPGTLAEISASSSNQASEWFAEGRTRYRTRATFTGRIRPVPAGTKQFIERWAQALGQPEADAKVFEQEVEISQGSAAYWLPIQNMLVAPLRAEVPAGAQVDLYLMLMGGHAGGIVMAINEFDALADAHAPAPAEVENR